MNISDKNIVIIGLGYVGLPLAVEFAKKRPVIGYDLKPERIEELKAGHDYTLEITAEELREARFLTLTNNTDKLRDGQIYIITVPTPVDKANRPDLTPLTQATGLVGRALNAGDVVIYESTVYPGATEEICVPILERESGLCYLTEDNAETPGQEGFYVGYSPERINPGDKAHRLPDIKKLTSGSTPQIAEAVSDLYAEIITAGTYKASSIRVAEAAKVIENAQRDLNIAFVNELSVIFNRMFIDTAEVLKAAATKWNFLPFKPGLVGGHCIGVDPYYLTHKAQELGYHPQVILSGRAMNDSMGLYAAQNVIKLMLKNGFNLANTTVGVLGVTFKENCPDVRNSKVVDVIQELQQWGLKVQIFDPWANAQKLQSEYGLTLSSITPETTVDSLVIAVGHTQFSQMTPSTLRKLCGGHNRPVIADLKSLYDRRQLEDQGFTVFRF